MEVVAHRSWRSTPQMRLIAEIESEVRTWGLERICADATGMGAPLIAMLRPAFGGRLEPVVFNAAVKSQMAYELIAAANTGRLSLYRDEGCLELEECLAELRACRSEGRRRGELSWFAPAGKHDDFVASLLLCQRAAANAGPPRVAVGRQRD